jgi:hypothetical protein
MSTRDISIWPVLGRSEVQERSEQSFTVRFLDNRALSAPDVARYKLIHLHTGQTVKDWTAITTPSSEETVVIPSDLNKIRSGCATEAYELVVQSDHDDTAKKQTMAIQYKVVNLATVED